jgi:hypothetical protein
MKAHILIHVDGSSTVGPIVPNKFNVRDWVYERLESFALLSVISVKEMVLTKTES